MLEAIVDVEDGSVLVPVVNSSGEVCEVPKDTVIGQVHEIEEVDGMLVVKAERNDDVAIDTGAICQASVGRSVSEDGCREWFKTILAKNVVHRTPENMKILETVLNHHQILHWVRRSKVKSVVWTSH